jgi:GTPase SAR1 family protein
MKDDIFLSVFNYLVMMKMSTVINFESLAKQFTGQYENFDKIFNSWYAKNKKKINKENPCYLMFGTSGAGKTTFMSRLCSRLSKEDFMEKLLSPGGNFSYFEDDEDPSIKFKVGHAIGQSTTLYPHPHTLGGSTHLNIVDMPGFNDADPSRRIIIDILHKCLLTRLEHFKFIVVLGVETFLDSVAAKNVESYTESFQALFGDRFDEYMSHLYFVLTKNDKHNATTDRIDAAGFKLLKASGNLGKPHVSKFIARMTDAYILVNYNDEEGEFIREALIEKVKDDLRGQGHSLTSDSISVSSLVAQGNLLTKYCDDELTFIEGKITATTTNLRKELENISSDLSREQTVVKTLTTEYEQQLMSDEEDFDMIAVLSKKLEGHEDYCTEITKEINESKQQTAFCEEQLAALDENLKGCENVNYRCDVAVETRPVVGSPYHTIALNINLNRQMKEGTLITLIVQAETNDASLATHISSVEKGAEQSNPLQPRSISTIKSFSNARSVLYHSTNGTNKFAGADLEYKTENNILIVKAKHRDPFKVFVYHTAPFNETQPSRVLKSHLEKNQESAAKSFKDAQGKLERAKDEHKSNANMRSMLVEKRVTKSSRLREAKEKMSSVAIKLKALPEHCEVLLEKYVRPSKQESYPSLQHISDIEAIYATNNLESDLRGRRAQIEHLLQSVAAMIDIGRRDLRSKVASIEKSLQESIEKKILPAN